MSDVPESQSGLPAFALFSYGFRPFFLAAGIWGAVAIALWIAMLTRGLELPSRFDPLTWHVHEMLFGFVLLVIGVGALGISLLDRAFPLSAAIHALTVGAVGTMILAVMTRATRGHTGHELRADGGTTLIYALVILAAAVRVGAALVERARADLLLVAAVPWVGAFGLFAVCYAPLMLRPGSTR